MWIEVQIRYIQLGLDRQFSEDEDVQMGETTLQAQYS